eukprot:scaffold68141_cov49-Attheya_sp.AAC.2
MSSPFYRGEKVMANPLKCWFLLLLMWEPLPCCSLITVTPFLTRCTSHRMSCSGSITSRRSASSDVGESAYGVGMNQEDMMDSDMLVAVDAKDRPILDQIVSKKEAHVFSPDSPRGVAHRAFSVFLFNSNGEMLLTKRASSKITFPDVWTNTCCSHPLHNMIPNEVDEVDALPEFPGIKHAAIRKLKHELGISPKDVPHQDFRFLTRFHYWASDTLTYGSDAPWGEHEIDYCLMIQCPGKIQLDPNPEEVGEIQWVSADELRDLMLSSEGSSEQRLWSPWFRGIMERGGFTWWGDLEEALKEGSKYCNKDITYFDPPPEHTGSYNLPTHGKDMGVLKNSKQEH